MPKKKVGRPTDPKLAKNRRRNVYLTYSAEHTIRKILLERPNFNLSQYVSECILRDFVRDPSKPYRMELGQVQQEITKLYDKAEKLKNEIVRINEMERRKYDAVENIQSKQI